MKRLVTLAFAVLATSADAATLETLIVPAGTLEVTRGTVPLRVGTTYTLRVSGTYTNAGPEGYGFEYDALYCFDVVNYAENSCADHHRAEDFRVRTGSGPFRDVDAFGDEGAPYRSDHGYAVEFHPPADGVLEAGTYLARTHCTTCQTTTTGAITVVVEGPGGGGSSGGPSVTVATDPPSCDDSARAAIAAATPCRFGQIGRLPAPGEDEVGAITSPRLPASTRSVEAVVDVQDSADEKLFEEFVVAVLKARKQRLRDQVVGCLIVGGVDPDLIDLGLKTTHPAVLVVLQACAEIMARTRTRTASAAAAGGCRAAFVPVVAPKASRKAMRQARASLRSRARATCDRGAGSQLHLTIAARGGRTLNTVLGKRVDAVAGTLAPAGSTHAAGSRMLFGWGYKAG